MTGTCGRGEGDPKDYVLAEVRGYCAEGFQGVKLKIGFVVAEDANLINAVQVAIGPDRKLMLDANHGYGRIEVIELGRRVVDQPIGWFEEPVIPEDPQAYREVGHGQPIPLAGGEFEFTRWGFRQVLAADAVGILQPDACAIGGLSGCKKIAAMATAFGVRYVPHV